MTPPTGFVGLSHLGIVSSAGWASFGQPVVAVDIDAVAVVALTAGRAPILEPGLSELIERYRGLMKFTTDCAALAECPLVVVSRDTPTDSANMPDTGPVLALIDAAVPHLRQDVVLAVMSQASPGFTRAVEARIRARRPELRFVLYYWVETLIFGQAVQRFREPERIMIGAAEPAVPLAAPLAEGLARFGCPVLTMRWESAELTKTAINLYLCAGVTYANTMADLCEAVGADWSEMAPALRLDRRIGPAAYIRPSLGIAGGNLERDMVALRALGRARGLDVELIETMLDYNERRRAWVHRQLAAHVLPHTPHPKLAAWGLAYKKNTRSTKNSTALRVLADLAGRAEVCAWDPALSAADVDVPAKIAAERTEPLRGADALLVLTDWDEFAAIGADEIAAMRRPLVIDCVGVVDAARLPTGTSFVAMGCPA